MVNDCKLIVFDMAGTTVADVSNGVSTVASSLLAAFANYGLDVSLEQINNQRGKEKKVAITRLLQQQRRSEELVNKIFNSFVDVLQRKISNFSEIAGTTELFKLLKSREIGLCVTSGFPSEIVDLLVERMGWLNEGLVGLAISSQLVGVSRPDPALITYAMDHFGITDPSLVLKVGDTVVDVLEGKNAGVCTVAVLTGTQTEEQLAQAKPDYILESIKDLPQILW